MNLNLTGYQIDRLLHQGTSTLIYRGTRDRDNIPAIVKTFKTEYPTLEEIARLRHEYKILQALDVKGIVYPLALAERHKGLALILEYFEGESLKQFIGDRPVELSEFLQIGIQLATILADLHQNHVIHKDIKPQNILINPDTLQVRIIDFSISSRLSKENPSFNHLNQLEGTLAYMSPEQTGRMNRCIDYRTDLYSLGVTFYEMLCATLPFTSTDLLELVHHHIAKTPKPPHQINPSIPPVVSEIVMKLLAKTAENRYQSALGLKADLDECWHQLQTIGKIDNFIPGDRDKSGQFLIPQKLYGREIEVTQILKAFARIATGKTGMMLVSGYSGIGKTSVVNEVHKPIVGAKGYFISGKFDQFKRNIPYASIVEAFQSLIQYILTETSRKIDEWKQKLLDAVGENGQLIIEVIPQLERIIGKQPPVAQLGATASQNRFNRVFKNFIHVFTQPEHPLVVFLDDLQWADAATLKLLELLMGDPDSQYLFIIGAYRDNEVSPTHPTIKTIARIEETGAVVDRIVLRPLDCDRVTELVADTLGEAPVTKPQSEKIAPSRIAPLAHLLFHKTGGNPFFLTQLLQTLYAENLLTFDFGSGKWQWDIEKIHAVGITDYNIVELIARNIQKLPPQTQRVLTFAACIGNQFNLDVLAIALDKSPLETATDLWDALQAGLILPRSQAYKIPMLVSVEESGYLGNSLRTNSSEQQIVSYKFLHDRVQQAAYSLIPETQKKQTHQKIGQLLLQATPEDKIADNIFDIVNQLNIAVDAIADPFQQYRIAELNLIAGQKAQAATAYKAAVKYLNVGLKLLPESSWQTDYDLTLALFVETVEAEYLNTHYDRAQQLSEVVIDRARTLLDKVKVYETQIQFYIAQNQMAEAIALALEVLKMLGVSVPAHPNKLNILLEFLGTKLKLANKPIEDLAELPPMTDPYKLAAMRILIALIVPAFLTRPNLFPLVAFNMVKLAIQYGNSSSAAYGYALYGWLLCGAIADIETGYQFGQLACLLLENLDARELQSKIVNVFNAFIRHWKEPLRNTIKPFDEALQIAIETGDIEYVGYSTINSCYYFFFAGDHLDTVVEQQQHYIELMKKLKQEYVIHSISIVTQLALNLMGKATDPCRLVGDRFNEEEMLPVFAAANILPSLVATYLSKAMLCYLFKNPAQSLENAELAERYTAGVAGFLTLVEHNFYYSLALLAQCDRVTATQQKRLLEKVNSNQKQMKRWAIHAPENYQHKYDLVEAEKARVLGGDATAIALYDRAITAAKTQGYLQEVAIALELFAEFYLSRDRNNQARFYLTESYYAYIRWGATAKIRDLELRYPQLLSQLQENRAIASSLNRTITATRTTTSTTGSISAVMDLTTAMKAAQAISSEIQRDRLLVTLMQIFMENAGATKGFMLLSKGDKLVLVAEGNLETDTYRLLPSVPIEISSNLPLSTINYIVKTRQSIIIDRAHTEKLFANDPYILHTEAKSILGLPLLHHDKFLGILYLENHLSDSTFTQERLEVLKLLGTQVAISLENADLYTELQAYSTKLELKNAALRESETREREKATELEKALQHLKQTQAKLVHTEKISTLGQLVAGVAHEVNNPVGFIAGNVNVATDYVKDLMDLLELYQQHLPEPPADIQEKIAEIDLEFLAEDLPEMLNSMKLGTDRIRDIMQSLRNFSRVDTETPKLTDIHQGINSTLMILQHRFKGKGEKKAIHVIKEYGDLPGLSCYPGQLNQVFMNLLANAIDAMEEERKTHEKEIRIRTEAIEGAELMENGKDFSPLENLSASDRYALIRIKDNGPGMTNEVHRQLFEAFFTTKPEGKGTGLGLSISYQIVVEKHKGAIACFSAPGEGAEFAIAIPL